MPPPFLKHTHIRARTSTLRRLPALDHSEAMGNFTSGGSSSADATCGERGGSSGESSESESGDDGGGDASNVYRLSVRDTVSQRVGEVRVRVGAGVDSATVDTPRVRHFSLCTKKDGVTYWRLNNNPRADNFGHGRLVRRGPAQPSPAQPSALCSVAFIGTR